MSKYKGKNFDPNYKKQDSRSRTEGLSDSDNIVKMNDEQKDEVISFLFNSLALDRQINEDQGHDRAYFDHSGRSFYFPPYQVLRAGGKFSVCTQIKSHRFRTLQKYATPISSSEKTQINKVGFNLKYRDASRNENKRDREYLDRIEANIARTLFYPPYSGVPSMGSFLGAAYSDYFDFDDITINVRRDIKNAPIGLTLFDPTLIYPVAKDQVSRHIDELSKEVTENPFMRRHGYSTGFDTGVPDYIMIIDGVLQGQFNKKQIMKYHHDIASDIRRIGRGFSIVEKVMNLITMMSNMINFNASNFTTAKVPDGVLAMIGSYGSQSLLETLKRSFNASMTDSRLKKRLPMIALPEKSDAKWIAFRNNSKDVEFHQWYTLLGTLLYSHAGTSPNEVGMSDHQQMMKAATISEQTNDGVTKASADAGEKSFLRHTETSLNHCGVFSEIATAEVDFEFIGFDSIDLKAKAELEKIYLETSHSVNDIRESQGMEKAELIVGDVNIYDIAAPNNQAVIQALSADRQQKQQEQIQQQQMQGQVQSGSQGNQPQGDPDDVQFSDEDLKKIKAAGLSIEEVKDQIKKG